jgi:hypothetical protein
MRARVSPVGIRVGYRVRVAPFSFFFSAFGSVVLPTVLYPVLYPRNLAIVQIRLSPALSHSRETSRTVVIVQ